MTSDDMTLVREYAQSNSEQAFATLVSRHVNLVYSVALRQVGNPHLAEEIAQGVFILLARKAKSLSPKIILSGWLCRTARYVSADTLKTQRRRQFRAQESQMQSNLNESDSALWNQIAPLLDEALNHLGEKEHDAVVLRFFDGMGLKQVGAAMGTTEDAARMRVNRALEKLRKFFARRGLALSTSVIAGAVAANSIQAAPTGLAAFITTAALSGTTITTAAVAATKGIAMTTLQKTVITATIAVLAAAGIYEGRQAANVRAEVQAIQRQQEPLTTQLQQLQRERDEIARQFASLREENDRLNRNTAELLKLRGEVTALRNTVQGFKQVETDPIFIAAKSLLERVNVLKKWVEQRPEEQIPEFQYLHDNDWIDAVKHSNMMGEHAPKNAMCGLRDSAKRQFAPELSSALRRFVKDHHGDLPTDLSQLNTYLQLPMTEALLKSYRLLHTGKLAEWPKNEGLIMEIAPPFEDDPGRCLLIGIDDWRFISREKLRLRQGSNE